MYASTLPRSNWLRRASIRLAWYRHMPASSYLYLYNSSSSNNNSIVIKRDNDSIDFWVTSYRRPLERSAGDELSGETGSTLARRSRDREGHVTGVTWRRSRQRFCTAEWRSQDCWWRRGRTQPTYNWSYYHSYSSWTTAVKEVFLIATKGSVHPIVWNDVLPA